jgi:ankyrin repeat protein
MVRSGDVVVDRQGRIDLHCAAAEGDLGREEDTFGDQPLSRAVTNSRGDCELIHVLLDGGAEPEHGNHSGNSALSTANLIANYDVKRCFDAAALGARTSPRSAKRSDR